MSRACRIRPFCFVRIVFAALAAVAGEPASAPPEPAAAQFQTLAPGLEYRHDRRPEIPLSIHVLRADRAVPWELRAGLGQGAVRGLEPLHGIVARAEAAAHRTAWAAINGDFFILKPGPYQGDPRGLQIADGELVSRPTGNSFWIAPDGAWRIGPVASKLRVEWPDGKTETLLGLNEARGDDDAVLYTPALELRRGDNPPATLGTHTQGGRELVLDSDGAPAMPNLRIGHVYRVRVREVRERGDSPLAPDVWVLSLGPKLLGSLPPAKPGDRLKVIVETEPDLRDAPAALGAGRILLQNGRLPDLGPANQPRHPRSLMGWNARSLFWMVVDGRQPALSIGMSYPEMAALAKEYGCTEAVELDGGGSSTLWAMGKILNSPSDGKPRPIANGLILFPAPTP